MKDQPAWLAHAWADLGTREAPGTGDNARILGYFRDVGHGEVTHDATPWCAAFVGACLERSGISSTHGLLARSYLDWGLACEPSLGAVVVLPRGSDPAAGHVGFLVGAADDGLLLLSGNQGDSVCVTRFPAADVLGYRWPAVGAHAVEAGDGDGFEAALAHVLAMEGGFDDDPADPGGPTNRGLTLVDLAAARGVALVGSTRAGLLADLKSISDGEVRSIYRTRYWRPSRATELPAPLALMHFDTAVNQGLGAAARLLQAAVGTEVDGEIGPLTLSAAAEADPSEALDRYAELRRQRYRRLTGFARFGRGWLNRVDATLNRALALISSTRTKETADMTTEQPNPGEPKWWGQSMTVWGTLITAAATVAPVLGPLIGFDISPEAIKQVGGQAAEAARGLAGLFGTLLALYGRARCPAVDPPRRLAAPLMRPAFMRGSGECRLTSGGKQPRSGLNVLLS